MIFVADGRSDSGLVRDHNEDSFRIDCDAGLFVVADGMGGHAAGEVASALAVEAVFERLTGTSPEAECTEEYLQSAVRHANRVIYSNALEHPERKGMGTTLTFMCWYADVFHFGHVGDSRAYRLRDAELTQLTRDHTWVNMQVRAGVISAEEAAHAQLRHVLVKALGTEPAVDADVIAVDARPKDRFLLCSDGLSDMVNDEDLRRVLSGKGTPGEVAERLVELANAFGGKDNITAVVIDCHDSRWTSKLKSAVDKIRR